MRRPDQPEIASTAGPSNEHRRNYNPRTGGQSFQNSKPGSTDAPSRHILSQQQIGRCLLSPAHKHGEQCQKLPLAAQPYSPYRETLHQLQSPMLTRGNHSSDYISALNGPATPRGFSKSTKVTVGGAADYFFNHHQLDPLGDAGFFPPDSGWGNSLPRADSLSSNIGGSLSARPQQVAIQGVSAYSMPDYYGDLFLPSAPIVPFSSRSALQPFMESFSSIDGNPRSIQRSHTGSTADTVACSLDDPDYLIFDFAGQSPRTRASVDQDPIAFKDSALPLQPSMRHDRATDMGYSSMPSIDNTRAGEYQKHAHSASVASQHHNRHAGPARMTGLPKGRKNALTPEQAAHAAAMRGVGACPACRKKKVKVGD